MGGRSGEGCGKDDYRAVFEKFGNITDIFMATDRQTRRENGNVYITYEKTSEAALAIEEMNGRPLPSHPKPLKVLLAAGKGENAVHGHREAEKLLRLFIIVPNHFKDDDVKDHFKEFGDIEYVRVLTEKGTGKSKGLAFVKYFRAYHSALAMEMCDPKFKPVFASTRTDREQEMVRRFGGPAQTPTNFGGPPPNMSFAQGSNDFNPTAGNVPSVADMISPRMGAGEVGQCRLEVMASTSVTQQQLWQLFDIIPGLEICDFDTFTGMGYVRYGQPKCAAHAIEKISGLEYPPGFRVSVRYQGGRGYTGDIKPPQMASSAGNVNDLCQNLQAMSQVPSVDGLQTLVESIQKATAVLQQAGLANVMGAPMAGMSPSPVANPMASQATTISQEGTAHYCSVALPDRQPTASRDSPIARRVFIVSHPERFSDDVLRDAFCRFGNLIDAYFVPGKNYGFAKYTDSDSAQRAMDTLHCQNICGMSIKVLEGEAPKYEDDHTQNRKRPHP
ncbi:RNA-binding protein 45 [Lamellibrachia satsuma]|nr:RNA-binding protein 45 [Lamellibrachia satsuma]